MEENKNAAGGAGETVQGGDGETEQVAGNVGNGSEGAAITGDAGGDSAGTGNGGDGALDAGKGAGTNAAAGGVSGEGDGGAITGEAQQAEDAIDWEKITDEEYIAKIPLPKGQEWNTDVMGEYAKLLKENKIDPKVFAKFVEKDAQMQKARGEKMKAEQTAKQAEARKAFREAGEEFRKTYTPEQVKEMNATLAAIDDPTFKTLVAKSPLANNKTMGKMLLAYQQVYGEDAVRGASGVGEGGEKTFEQVWTGK